MKLFHMYDFKCTLCREWFNPPITLPYLLKCTHSICSDCLTAAKLSHSHEIICPEDYEVNLLAEINVNNTTKRALERLSRYHRNYNYNTQLLCIQALSQSFEEILSKKNKEISNFSQLIDQIFTNEIHRIQCIYDRVKGELARPYRIVQDWYYVVKIYLAGLKNADRSGISNVNFSELNHYVDEGRKIKAELNDFVGIRFDELANVVANNSSICFKKRFTIYEIARNNGFCNEKKEVEDKNVELVKKMTARLKQDRQSYTVDYSEFLKQECKYNYSPLQEKKMNHLVNREQIDNKGNSKTINSFVNNANHIGNRNRNNYNSSYNSHKDSYANNNHNTSNGNNSHNSSNGNGVTCLKKPPNYTEKYPKIFKMQHCNTFGSPDTDPDHRTSQKYDDNAPSYPNERHTLPCRYKPLSSFELPNNYGSTLRPDYCLSKLKTLCRLNLRKDYKGSSKSSKYLDAYMLFSPYMTDPNEERQDTSGQEELLLSYRYGQWKIGNKNFLRYFELSSTTAPKNELYIKRKDHFDYEKQKKTYQQRTYIAKVYYAIQETKVDGNVIYIINYPLHDVDIKLFLYCFDWNVIEVVKLVNTDINDGQFNQLLNFLLNSQVTTLVLPGNNLNEISLDALLHFVCENGFLKKVYISKNNINILKGKAKAKIVLLKEKGLTMYV